MATETKATPKAEVFSVSSPYLSVGRINIELAKTDNLWLSLKTNAEGGENAIHKHTLEDHAFVVLEGEVTFFDETGKETVLGPYQGIMLPKGAYYRYLNTGGKNLFLLRVGSGRRGGQNGATRIRPDGQAIPSNTAENHHIDGVPITGKTFGAQE